MPDRIIFAQVLRQLIDEQYKRNRADLAKKTHVSPSAISQYVRGRATPGLDVLVDLADALGVSLDYLVLGKDRVIPPPGPGYLTGHLESHVRSTQAKTAALHDLVSRIGSRLGELVHSTAEEVVSQAKGLGGALNNSEAAALERCSTHTTIVTADLSLEVLIFTSDEKRDQSAAPSVFAQVIVDNIAEGGCYEYVVPQGSKWGQESRLLRQEIIRAGSFDSSHVDRNLTTLSVPHACIPGFVVQHILLDRLYDRAAIVADRINPFVYPDPVDEKKGYVAYIEPGSNSYELFGLIAKENVPSVLEELQILRKSA